jgi:hypothetical protein
MENRTLEEEKKQRVIIHSILVDLQFKPQVKAMKFHMNGKDLCLLWYKLMLQMFCSISTTNLPQNKSWIYLFVAIVLLHFNLDIAFT